MMIKVRLKKFHNIDRQTLTNHRSLKTNFMFKRSINTPNTSKQDYFNNEQKITISMTLMII